MSYDITDHDGYLIDLKILTGDFPEKLATLKEEYAALAELEINEVVMTNDQDWMIDTVGLMISEFVKEHIHKDLSVEVMGSWRYEIQGYNPFEDGEAYAYFSPDELTDEVRKNGERCLSESELFVQLKAFMKAHNIPEESLRHEKWRSGC